MILTPSSTSSTASHYKIHSMQFVSHHHCFYTLPVTHSHLFSLLCQHPIKSIRILNSNIYSVMKTPIINFTQKEEDNVNISCHKINWNIREVTKGTVAHTCIQSRPCFNLLHSFVSNSNQLPPFSPSPTVYNIRTYENNTTRI